MREQLQMSQTHTLPTFFLGGAPKSGTTTLHYVLAQHPEIFMSETKEPHFFDTDANYAKGLDWYASFFENASNAKAVGESTAEYLCYPSVPKRIAEVIPAAKFIFLLRNPITRSYSAYWHAVRYGREKTSFEEAIVQEPERIAQDHIANRYNAYVSRGHYHIQLKCFMEYFDPSSILVLIFEEFVKAPTERLSAVAQFLSVRPDHHWLQNTAKEHKNIGKIPRFVSLQSLYPLLSRKFPVASRALLRFNVRNHTYKPMSESVLRKLKEEFRESNEELEKMLGRKLDVWEDTFLSND